MRGIGGRISGSDYSSFRKGAIYAGSTCRGHNNPTLLVLRRASNHSLNPSPIVGKGLKKIIAETADYFYVLVLRDDAMSFYIRGEEPPTHGSGGKKK